MERSLARIREFYRGRRKRHNVVILPFAIALGVIALVLVTFYGLQKYAVITREGVDVRLPGQKKDENVIIDSQGNEVRVFEKVDTQIAFDQPDYSRVAATAGRYLSGVRAIFVPAEDITQEKLDEYVQRLARGNALVLEMKPRSGMLMWNSSTVMAQNYLLSPAVEIGNRTSSLVTSLKEKGIYLVAQISCCIDDTLASRSTSFSLRNQYGVTFRSAEGNWLDPYNEDVRDYVVGMVQELYDMGFDEVVLADVLHPAPTTLEGSGEQVGFLYTRDMSTTPGPVNAVCGFALYVAQQLSGRTGFLSIYTDSLPSLVRADETTGQDAVLFMKLYDRVYIRTDTYSYTFHVEDIQNNVTIGNVRTRLVPVLTNYLFADEDTSATSWVLVDVKKDED